MAHYALIDSNNVVVQVITGVDEDVVQYDNGRPVGGSTEAWEQFYETRPWFNGLRCKRTSYNGNFRFRYAGIGMVYNEEHDVFMWPQPYPSWILDTATFTWVPPVPKPDDVEGYAWVWNMDLSQWEQVEQIQLVPDTFDGE